MVSSSHEALHRIFQEDTGAIVRALRQLLGVPFPETSSAFVVSPDLTEIAPVERRVDTLLQVETEADGTYLFAIESQSRRDPKKPAAWAYYLSYMHAKFGHQPVLIVLCPDEATARWAAHPISLGIPDCPSLTVRPLVLGPGNTPVVTDAKDVVRDVPMAVFSAITHSRSENVDAILKALATTLNSLDPEQATIYAELVEAGLGNTPARKIWSDLMSALLNFFRSEHAQRAFAEVRAETRAETQVEVRAESVLRVLNARGLEVTAETRERVGSCKDLALLDTWLDRAVTASRAEDLFVDG
ncbi:hypothetical protein V2J94_35000 [Streptomyces sp. DSM 41524]|uniref:Transposase (putative) YhgA-like domain-containing protein n=1 Tax=Streptomyces asiaticus subsp. ignotus TaxID=3098222 RepID=A0ABU7Q8U5_9ACTN|nr:hypothetical protein [Streptomyces sp. DSM 41524]